MNHFSNDKLLNLKGKFPFSLGTTSYIIPDDVLPNVKFLVPFLDDIEIVLFESEEISNLPNQTIINELNQIGKQNALTYSIHFPIDQKAGSPNKNERTFFVNQVLKIIDLFQKSPISAFILHLEGLQLNPSENEIIEWQKNVSEVCTEIQTRISPEQNALIAVETLGYPPFLNIPVIEQFNFKHCIDIGHVWLYNQEWQRVTEKMLPSTRVFHLHGVANSKDHLSLDLNDKSVLKSFFNKALRSFDGLVTLEIFDLESLIKSCKVINDLWEN